MNSSPSNVVDELNDLRREKYRQNPVRWVIWSGTTDWRAELSARNLISPWLCYVTQQSISSPKQEIEAVEPWRTRLVRRGDHDAVEENARSLVSKHPTRHHQFTRRVLEARNDYKGSQETTTSKELSRMYLLSVSLEMTTLRQCQ